MPVMDGYAAAQMIRASGMPNAREIPIVPVAANAFSDDAENCRAAGMNDPIAKPIEYDPLFKKMARLLLK